MFSFLPDDLFYCFSRIYPLNPFSLLTYNPHVITHTIIMNPCIKSHRDRGKILCLCAYTIATNNMVNGSRLLVNGQWLIRDFFIPRLEIMYRTFDLQQQILNYFNLFI